MKTIIALIVGLFIAWSYPQPQIAIDAQKQGFKFLKEFVAKMAVEPKS